MARKIHPERGEPRPRKRSKKVSPAQNPTPAKAAPTTADPERSPILGVRKAGDGALRPLIAHPTRRVLAIITEPTSEEANRPLPTGVLLTADVLPSAAEEVQNALGNPAGSLSRAMYVGRTTPGTIRFGVDMVLQQFAYLVAVAFEVLDRFAGVDRGLRERVRARELLDYLAEWARDTMLKRAGNDATVPLKVPAGVARASVTLAVLGRRLRHYWTELSLVRSGSPSWGASEPEPSKRLRPLTQSETAVLKVLWALSRGQGLIGKDLLARLPAASGVSQELLTSRVIPGLRKKGWDVPNEGGGGYYLSAADRVAADGLFGRSNAASM